MYKKNIDELNATSNGKQNDFPMARNASLASLRSEDIKLGSINGVGNGSEVTSNDPNPINTSSLQDPRTLSTNTNAHYRRLCDKLNLDLTSVGELKISLKHCDRLPESLFTLNLPPTATQSPQSLPTNDSFVYITASLDPLSMSDLMERQICKETWPLIEFEITRTNPNQLIGFILTQIILINKTEVVIQKILPNSLIESVKKVRPFDIIHSVNNVRIGSIKQFNKVMQKVGVNSPLKFVVQRPCVVLDNGKVLAAMQKRPSQNALDTNGLTDASNPVSKEGSPQQGSNTVNNNNNTSSLVSNTRLRLEKLEQKIKSSFTSSAPSQPNDSQTGEMGLQRIPSSSSFTNINSQNTPSNSPSLAASSQNAQNPTPSLSILASANTLVDFFCSVAESSPVN